MLTTAAGLLAIGAGRGAGAQVSQVSCGNQMCASNPGGCNSGCVCCVYTNPITGKVTNSRCRPPGTCSPGTVACAPGLRYCPNLGRCAACCADVDCSDGDACTVDTCREGVCRHDPVSCDDNNACTADSCDPATGCRHEQVNCDDGNPCTDDTCNPQSGCAHTPNTASCNAQDGAAGTCASGTCVANPTTTTTTAAPKPCTGCAPSQNACLSNGSCADQCTSSLNCPFVCFCGFPSIEGPQYCVSGEGSCDGFAACSSTAQCPQGNVCQPVSCGDGTVAYRCVPLCATT